MSSQRASQRAAKQIANPIVNKTALIASSPLPAPLAPGNFRKKYIQASAVTLLMLVAGFWWWLRTPGNLSPALGGAELAPALDFKSVPNVPTGLFKYGGSAVWASIRPQFETVMKLDHPNLRLQYVEGKGTPGSGQGLQMLLAGEVDFIQSSRALKDAEYQAAQQQGFKLVEEPIAWDGIAVVVHPSLSIPGLTVSQLRQIYLGKITNWKQIGGPNRAIKAFSRLPEDSGTADYFQANLLQKPLGSKVVPVYSTTDAVRQLGHTPGGIYYASAAEVLYHCLVKPLPLGKTAKQFVSPYSPPLVAQKNCPQNRNRPNVKAFRDRSYPITRRLYMVVKRDQSAAEQAGEAYGAMLLSEQGQQLLEKSGFARIN
ncbi:MAG: PstS family phosphate ABC transporter substrate-binding protein [Acaryochloridaceae cyanobacterium SU_2_1]|nr:PstS family phosphate ABC transporter substrate-binding protein [Acaryochloridaceae cyanobacterium SU_2_1]